MSTWIPNRRPVFARQFGRLDSKTKKRAEYAVSNLLAADNPALLGKYKQGKRVFSYEIGRKYRIIYNVNWARR